MASSRRTYDTDSITLRTVFAKNPGNSNVPALRVLTADGAGGTYWAIPSTLGIIPSFNEIITSAGTYTADLSYNRFRLLAGEGIGMVNGPTGSNQTSLFAKAFSQFDISGENTLYAFANNQLDPSVTFAGENGIQIRADPATNTFFIGASGNGQTLISTGIYGFSQLKVTPTTSTITSSLLGWDGDFISATSPSTLLRFAGFNDIQLSTNVTTNTVFFTISTFTSEGYLSMSNAAFSAYPSTLSTVSSLYVQKSIYDSTIFSLSTNAVQWSSVQSSINALAFSTGAEFLKLTGLINARATIVQLNNNIAQVNSNIVSTTQGLGSAGYISTAGGGSGDVTKANLISTVAGLGTYGYISTAGGGSGDVTKANLTSTVEGLGTYGYISSLSSLTISTLFNTGSISTFSLEVYGSNTLTNSGSTILRGAIYLAGPTYVAGSFTGTNIVSSSNLTSSIIGLGSAGYISSFNALRVSSGTLTASTLNLIDPFNNNVNFLTVSGATLLLNGSFVSGGAGGGGGGGVSQILAGTGISLSPAGGTGVVTVTNTGPTSANLVSTVQGLGTAGYVSTASLSNLVSTPNLLNLVSSPNLLNLVSTPNLLNLVSTPNLLNLVSSPNLLNLVSSPNLLNLVSSPNLLDLVSTPNLLDLVSSPNLLDLVSSPNLLNLVSSPNLLDLVSSPNLLNLVSTNNLRGVVSTLNLLNLVSTNNLRGVVSTLNLLNLVSTNNLRNLISTANLVDLVSTPNLLDFISTPNLLDLVSTPNLIDLISSPNLISSIFGLSNVAVTKINQGTNITVTNGGIGEVTISVVGAGLTSAELTSSVRGLGTAGYLSSFNALRMSTGNITVSTVNLIDPYTNLQSYLTVSSSKLLLDGLFITGAITGGGGGAVTQILAGAGIGVSPPTGIGNVQITNLYPSGSDLISTVAGLGTNGYISTLSLVSTTLGLQRSGFLSTSALTSTVAGLGTIAYVSTSGLTSTVRGLGTQGFVSTSWLNSTVRGLGQIYVSTVRDVVSTPNLLDLVSTPNLLDLVSSPNLLNLVSSPNLLDLVSSPNLLNLISTSFFDSQIRSTVRGLGSATYISSLSFQSSLVSTTSGLERYISSFIDPRELASSLQPFISTPNLLNLVSTPNLLNLVSTPNLLNLVSSPNLLNLVSTPNLLNLVSTPNLLNLVSTPNLLNLVSTPNLLNLVSSPNLVNLVSTGFLDTRLASTVQGLGTTTYISSLSFQSSLVSTTSGLERYISSFIDPRELASSLQPFISTPNLLNLVSTPNLLNLVSTPNLLNLVSSPNLLNLVSTPNLLNLVSTPNLLNLVSTPNLLNLVSTPNLLNLVSTPNLLNLVSTPNLLNLVSTPNLLNLVSSPNLLDLVSTPNLLNLVSTPNLLNLVSTSFLDTQLASTVKHLGVAGYVSAITGMFTLTATTPANITFEPPTNTISKSQNDSADDFIESQERYPYAGVAFQPAFQTYDNQTVRLSRGTNDYYGILFSNNGMVYVEIDNTATVTIGSFSPSNLDFYSLQIIPDDVIYYRNNLLVHVTNSNPTEGPYNLTLNLRKTGDTLSNISFAGTTSPNEVANSYLYFNTPTAYATNMLIEKSLVSSFNSFTGGGGVTTQQLISTTQRLNVSTIIIPYQQVNTNIGFQLSNSPTQLFFGSTTNTQAQIYVADLAFLLGNSNSNFPMVQLETTSYFTTTSNVQTYTGSQGTFNVPAGVSELTVELFGAGGGSSSNAFGGAGGYVIGQLQVTPGESLDIFVGGAGQSDTSSAFSAGGQGGASGIGGGGGITAITRGLTILVAAGAGGGGGSGNNGGDGGGTSGTAGQGTGGGGGGTQSAGGTLGGGTATAGSIGTGGDGDTSGGGGGGGGSGYYGGGGGADGDGGGGGSSYSALLTNATNTTGSGSPSDTNGYINISYKEPVFRPGRFLQMDNHLSNRFIVDHSLRTGINISSIDQRYFLDVSGGAKVSSLTLGTYSISGVLGTDATATNLYWNGTQVNGGGGGGITTQQLTSTVTGIGDGSFVFNTISTASIVLSTATSNYKLTASTNTLTSLPNLWMNDRIYGTYNPVKVVVSTLGAENANIFEHDLGKYFLFTQNNQNTSINFPTVNTSLDGWNVVIKNMPASAYTFSVSTTTTSGVNIAPGVATTVVCDGLSFYSI